MEGIFIKSFYLFLDFDGVLITRFSEKSNRHSGLEFDPQCLFTLEKVIQLIKKHFEAVNIVITSNWRYDLTDLELEVLVQNPLVDGVLILEEPESKHMALRKFIEKYQLPEESYIIFDDDELDEPSQIQTQARDGIRDSEHILYMVSRYLSR